MHTSENQACPHKHYTATYISGILMRPGELDHQWNYQGADCAHLEGTIYVHVDSICNDRGKINRLACAHYLHNHAV